MCMAKLMCFSFLSVVMWQDEEALLEASRKAYQEKFNSEDQAYTSKESFKDGAEVIMLDDDETLTVPQTTKEDAVTSKVKKTEPKKQRKRRTSLLDTHENSLSALEVTGGTTVSRKPSKRELGEYRSQNAGPKWYGMPSFPRSSSKNVLKDSRIEGGKSSYTGGDARAATEKEMRQQITAIRLRNALDPKRFYRGSGGTGSERLVPAYAQLGKIVGGGLEPSSMLTKKQRADSVVGELLRDTSAVSYSKRKFGEVRISMSTHTCPIATGKTYG